MGEYSDQQLIDQYLAGNAQAFTVLMGRHVGPMARLIHGMVADHDTVDDIIQEVSIRVFRSLAKFRADALFSTWLYRVTLNTTRNYMSRQRQFLTMGEVGDFHAELATGRFRPREYTNPENTLVCDEMVDAMIKAMDIMPEIQSDAVLLAEVLGKTYLEIAEILHCPSGTVRSRVYRAKLQLDHAIVCFLSA